jgi:hypothetical protein
MEKCIYCNSPNNLTDSHIIPEGLGSKLKLPKSVCHECNAFIGRTIEAKICSDFSFYRFLAQIETKKGKDVTTPGDLEILGSKVTVQIGEAGIPKFVPPIVVEQGPPRKFLVLAESPEKLRKYMKQFEKMGIQFETDQATPQDVKVTFTAEKRYISSHDYLRVMSKIAFEYLCYISPLRAFNTEYAKIKGFIRYGQCTNGKPARLIFEDRLVNGILSLPFPFHGILLFGYQKMIGSIISIFGIFYYFVLLNNDNPSLQDWVRFIYFIPQTKESRVPILQHDYSLKTIVDLIRISLRDPNVEQKIQKFSKEKLDVVLKNIRIKKPK